MNHLKQSFHQFLTAIPSLIRIHGFSVLFYTTSIISAYLFYYPSPLNTFTGRIISVASANMVSITGRISGAFFSIILAIAVSLFFIWFFSTIHKYFRHDSTNKTFQAISFIGILYFFSHIIFLKGSLLPTILIIPLLHLICLIVDRLSDRWNMFQTRCSPLFMGWLFVVSFSLAMFLADQHPTLLNFSRIDTTIIFLGVSILFSFITSTIWGFIRRERSSLFLITTPFAFLGFLPFLSREIPFILMNHGITIVNPSTISLIGCCVIFGSSFILAIAGRSWSLSDEKLIARFYFPISLVTMGILFGYSPSATTPPFFFEPANPQLFLQQFFDFGKIPFIETFNAHGLSDAFWGFIHSFIHGYNLIDVIRYDFLQQIIELLLSYIFVLKITKNKYLAFILVGFFPSLGFIFPPFFLMVFVILLTFIYAIKTQKIPAYILLVCALVFITLWKIELGTLGFVAVIASNFLLYFAKQPALQWKKFIACLVGIGIIAFIVFLVLCNIKDVSAFSRLKDIAAILNSNQTFGYTAVWNKFDKYSLWNYFIFPSILLIGICGVTLYGYLKKISLPRTVFISFFFLSIFTIINLITRGIVRHSLVESTTIVLSGFSTLLLGGMVFFLLEKHTLYVRSIAFVAVVSFMTFCMGIPGVISSYDQGLFTKSITNLEKLSAPYSRTSSETSVEFTHLITFIKDQLEKDETFFDFSTNPMLYAYTHKKTPFYTNHLMLAHNDYLQDRVLEDINRHNIPLLIFSHVNQPYNLDGIPFQFRNYKLAEYFYQHYHPYAVIDSVEVWVRNDWQPKKELPEEKILLSTHKLLSSTKENHMLRNGMRFTATNFDPFVYNLITTTPPVLTSSKSYTMIVEGYSKTAGEFQFFWRTDNTPFDQRRSVITPLIAGYNTLNLPLKLEQETSQLTDLRLDFPEHSWFEVTNLKLLESSGVKYLSDQHSLASQNFTVGYIPYLWGSKDKTDVDKLPVLRDISTNHFDPLTKKEKGVGAYIVAHIKIPLGNPWDTDSDQVILSYGDNEQTRGTMTFTAPRDGLSHRYTLRISTQYSWVDYENNWITLKSATGTSLPEIHASLVQADM